MGARTTLFRGHEVNREEMEGTLMARKDTMEFELKVRLTVDVAAFKAFTNTIPTRTILGVTLEDEIEQFLADFGHGQLAGERVNVLNNIKVMAL